MIEHAHAHAHEREHAQGVGTGVTGVLTGVAKTGVSAAATIGGGATATLAAAGKAGAQKAISLYTRFLFNDFILRREFVRRLKAAQHSPDDSPFLFLEFLPLILYILP